MNAGMFFPALLAALTVGALGVAGEHGDDTKKRNGDQTIEAVVPFEWGFSQEVLDNVPKEIRDGILKTTGVALTTVKAHPPKGDNIFTWNGKKDTLKNKDAELILTTSDDPAMRAAMKAVGAKLGDDVDTLTLFVGRQDGKGTIHTYVLLDRILADEKGQPRKDALARLTVGLAHELYGNGKAYLDLDLAKPPKADAATMKKMAVASHQATLDFIDRVETGPFAKNLPAKVKADFAAAKEREKKLLEAAQK